MVVSGVTWVDCIDVDLKINESRSALWEQEEMYCCQSEGHVRGKFGKRCISNCFCGMFYTGQSER